MLAKSEFRVTVKASLKLALVRSRRGSFLRVSSFEESITVSLFKNILRDLAMRPTTVLVPKMLM